MPLSFYLISVAWRCHVLLGFRTSLLYSKTSEFNLEQSYDFPVPMWSWRISVSTSLNASKTLTFISCDVISITCTPMHDDISGPRTISEHVNFKFRNNENRLITAESSGFIRYVAVSSWMNDIFIENEDTVIRYVAVGSWMNYIFIENEDTGQFHAHIFTASH